jgi:hypothetical protein
MDQGREAYLGKADACARRRTREQAFALAFAFGLIAAPGCAPDGGTMPGDTSGANGPTGATGPGSPPPYHQVADMDPPTGLTVATDGTRVTISWTPPSPAPGGYILLAGGSPDSLNFVTSTVPRGSSLDVGTFFGRPRDKAFYVALQSYRTSDSGHSAASQAVQVTLPHFDSATLTVDCAVGQVNDAPYLTGSSFQGTYSPGSCVQGTFRNMDMSTAYDRTYGASYTVDGIGRILDLGVVQSERSSDPMDGPYPAMWFQLSPLSDVTSGSSWANWVDALGPGASQAYGGLYELYLEYGPGPICLHGLATGGSLTVTSASGLDVPGQGAFHVQGTVTFSDPFTVPGLCDQTCCD